MNFENQFQPGMGPRGPRNDWNRPPSQMQHQGFQQPPGFQQQNQQNQMMQGHPPRGVPPQQQHAPSNMQHGQQMPAPHVNPAFFNQNSGKYTNFI